MGNETEKKLQLLSPITIEGREISEITLREPTAGELDFAEQSSKTLTGNTIQIIASVSGLHPAVIKQLGARDFAAAAGYIKPFLLNSPETGAN